MKKSINFDLDTNKLKELYPNKSYTKEFNVFAGVDGAGKTTLYFKQLETEKNKNFGLRVNIDEIVQAIGDWKNPKDLIRASKIALKIRNEHLENGYSFNQETTLCGKSIISFIHKAKDKGYKINLYYVGLESEQIAKDRVKIRVAKGGHDIAPELIERRYKESLENLKSILPIVNNLYLFDNSKEFKSIETKKDIENITWLKNIDVSQKMV
ncbi:zeta toxin family protein [Arcobacter cryaerophilus gv. pseudocryaerophilus]